MGQIVSFALGGEADLSFKDLYGDGAVGMMLLHSGTTLHRDQDGSEIRLLKQGLCEMAGGPGLLASGIGDLLCQVESRKIVDHVAVVS